jgi:hypothetical protein
MTIIVATIAENAYREWLFDDEALMNPVAVVGSYTRLERYLDEFDDEGDSRGPFGELVEAAMQEVFETSESKALELAQGIILGAWGNVVRDRAEQFVSELTKYEEAKMHGFD